MPDINEYIHIITLADHDCYSPTYVYGPPVPDWNNYVRSFLQTAAKNALNKALVQPIDHTNPNKRRKVMDEDNLLKELLLLLNEQGYEVVKLQECKLSNDSFELYQNYSKEDQQNVKKETYNLILASNKAVYERQEYSNTSKKFPKRLIGDNCYQILYKDTKKDKGTCIGVMWAKTEKEAIIKWKAIPKTHIAKAIYSKLNGECRAKRDRLLEKVVNYKTKDDANNH